MSGFSEQEFKETQDNKPISTRNTDIESPEPQISPGNVILSQNSELLSPVDTEEELKAKEKETKKQLKLQRIEEKRQKQIEERDAAKSRRVRADSVNQEIGRSHFCCCISRRIFTDPLSSTLGLEKHPITRGIPFVLIIILIPIAFTIIMAGVIPLGNPDHDVYNRQGIWPWLWIINPACMTVIAYVTLSAFYHLSMVPHPFRQQIFILILVYLIQLFVFVPIISTVGFFDLFGLCSYILAQLSAFGIMLIYFCFLRAKKSIILLLKYFRVQIAFLVYFFELIGFIVAYRHVDSEVQTILNIVLQITVFFWRKILLSLTKDFTFDSAILVSSLWITNMSDMFIVMAYPLVRAYYVFAILWAVDLISVVLNMLLITRMWFVFQLKVKDILAFRPCRKIGWTVEIREEDPDDRGQSPNYNGFRRRQARFYLWKCFSKCVAALFYLGLAPVLRWGVNKEYYIVSVDPFRVIDSGDFTVMTTSEFTASMVYALVDFWFIVIAGVVGVLILRFKYTVIWKQLREEWRRIDRNYVALAGAIIANNGLLAVLIVQYHWQVWWGFAREYEE